MVYSMSEKTLARQEFFLDREDSLQILSDVFSSGCETSKKHFVFLEGEPGIGKTSLVEKFLSSLDTNDTIILQTRGYEEHDTPLFSFIEMMKNFLSIHRSISKGELFESILNLAKIMPGLEPYVNAVLEVTKTVRGLSDVDKYSLDNNYYVFSNYLSIMQKLSVKKILLIFIDDVQWLDSTSFELLAFLMRKITQRVIIITSIRSGSITLQKELDNKDKFDRLCDIAPENSILIKMESVQEKWYPKFIEFFLGNHKFTRDSIQSLHKQTEGNPFFLKSVLRLLKESGTISQDRNGMWFFSGEKEIVKPRNLHETLIKRLRKVYGDISGSKQILTYAAVLGYRFDVETLSDFLNKDRVETYHILSEIENTYAMVKRIGDTTAFVFDHGKTQEAIYSDLGALASDCHKRIAEFLENPGRHADPFVISYHYYRAREWENALKYLQISAKTATDNYFFSYAIKQYDECFSIVQKRNIRLSLQEYDLLRLGYAKSLLGNNSIQQCITNLNDLLQSNTIPDEQIAEANLLLSKCYRQEGKQESGRKAMQTAEKSMQIYEKSQDPQRLGEIYSYLATVYDHFGDYQKAVKYFEKSQVMYNRANDNSGLARLQRKSGMIYESRRAIEFMKNSLDTFERYSMRIEKSRCLNNMGAEYFYIGNFAESEKHLAASLELFRGLDSPEVDIPLNNLGLVYQQKGDYFKAMQFFEDSHAISSEPFNEIFVGMNMANIHRQKKELEKARQILMHLQPLVEAYPEPVMNDYYGFNRSVVHLELGEIEEAEKWLLRYPTNGYKNDNELATAKRLMILSRIHDKKRVDSGEEKKKSSELFQTARPQKWFYELDYYPSDIHIWD